jgi:hypothetical protein
MSFLSRKPENFRTKKSGESTGILFKNIHSYKAKITPIFSKFA